LSKQTSRFAKHVALHVQIAWVGPVHHGRVASQRQRLVQPGLRPFLLAEL
jgi:hypothetical protein